jgi:peroxiredoxin Q/BCP
MSGLGTRAPLFRLQAHDGSWLELSDLLAVGPVLLAFYPKDFGLVCTKQLCAYQEALESFNRLGCQIVGISKVPPQNLRNFRDTYKFDFPLLSDPNHVVAKLYNVTSLMMMGGTSRAVVVIGKSGIVLYRYVEHTVATHRKPGELIKVVEELRARGML